MAGQKQISLSLPFGFLLSTFLFFQAILIVVTVAFVQVRHLLYK